MAAAESRLLARKGGAPGPSTVGAPPRGPRTRGRCIVAEDTGGCVAGPGGPGGPGRLLLGGRAGGVKASLQWKRGGSEGGEEEAWGAGGEPRSGGTRLDRRAAPQLYEGALRLIAGGGGGAGEGALPLGRKQGLLLPPEGTGSGSLGCGKSPPGPARGGKACGTEGVSGGREPGPPLSGVVGGTRQGGRAEGGPGDTVWNNWGLAPSPAIKEMKDQPVAPLPRIFFCLPHPFSYKLPASLCPPLTKQLPTPPFPLLPLTELLPPSLFQAHKSSSVFHKVKKTHQEKSVSRWSPYCGTELP